MRGLSVWEITKMIEQKKKEMMSSLEENNIYIREIQDEMAHLKFRLDHISLTEEKARQAV